MVSPQQRILRQEIRSDTRVGTWTLKPGCIIIGLDIIRRNWGGFYRLIRLALKTQDDLDLYSYAANDPIDRTDPAGTESPTVIFNKSFGEQSDPETAGRVVAASLAFSVISGVDALGEAINGKYIAASIFGAVDVAPLGSYGASALKRNMMEAGIKFAKGDEAHYIVAEELAAFRGARDILEELGIDLHESVNGAKLDEQFHRASGSIAHSAATAKTVAERISRAAKAGADAVRAELQKIGKQLERAGKECKKTGTHIC
jgi:hypothetical protein